LHQRTNKEGRRVLRVLVSFDDTHRSYRILIARALRKLRPHLEVRHAPLDDFDAQLRFFEPHVVVCSLPKGAAEGEANGAEDPIASAWGASRGAWVMAPVDTSRPAEICLDGEVWNTDGPYLSEVLEIIDETEARLNEGRLVGGC
jgi:hypothetical protein